MDNPIVHIAEDGKEHALKEHIEGTAKLASAFAADFGCREWDYLAGLWHDWGNSPFLL